MIRNIDIVFRLLALPFHLAVAQTWMLVAVIAAGYFAIAWFGVDPVRILAYRFIALATIGIAVSAAQFGSMPLAIGIMGAAVIAMVFLEPVFQRVMPKNAGYRVTQEIPLDFQFKVRGDRAYGTAVNRSGDWFEKALVECQGFYRNGEPVEQPWIKSISGFAWLPPEEGTGSRELFQRPYDASRFDLSQTICRIAHADFRKAPLAVPKFTYTLIPGSGFVRFHVVNDTVLTLTAVRFSCLQSLDIRVTFGTQPMFQQALDYEIAPGATFDLISQRMFTTISGCHVYSVDAK